MKKNRILVKIAVISLIAFNGFSQNVNWISSTEKQPWKTKEAIKLNEFNESTLVDIEILTDKKQQIIEGWGGCFNELGWQALNLLPFKERDKVIKEFFDTNEGLKYNYCRMPIVPMITHLIGIL